MNPGATTSQQAPITTIPLIEADLPAFDAVEASLREILKSGRITNFGKYVRGFEERATEYLGADAAKTSPGTMALLFTLQAMGLERGQKLILPSFTFMATAKLLSTRVACHSLWNAKRTWRFARRPR